MPIGLRIALDQGERDPAFLSGGGAQGQAKQVSWMRRGHDVSPNHRSCQRLPICFQHNVAGMNINFLRYHQLDTVGVGVKSERVQSNVFSMSDQVAEVADRLVLENTSGREEQREQSVLKSCLLMDHGAKSFSRQSIRFTGKSARGRRSREKGWANGKDN